MSIWSDLATQLGTQLAGTVGTELINRVQTRLRGSDPVSAFNPFDEPWMGNNMPDLGLLTQSLPSLVGAAGTALMGGNGRKRRRINSTNVHALRRALRRVESFVKVEKRVDKIVNRVSRSSRAARRHGFVRDGGGARRGAQPGTQVINVD